MNNSIDLQEIYTTKKINKFSRRAISVCVFTCIFMLIIQIGCAYALSALNINLDNEIIEIFASSITYIISLVLPFSIAFSIFKFKFKNAQKYSFKREFPKAPILYICGVIGIGYITNLMLNLLFPKFIEFHYIEPGDPPTTVLGMVLLYITNALLPAILEEWAFRGIICKNLLTYGKNGAIIISSLLFGIMHIDPPRIVFTFVIGIFLAICYEITGSLALPMLIHFLNNALSVTALLFVDEIDITVTSLLFSFLIIIFMILGVVFLISSRNGITSKRIFFNKKLNIGYELSTSKYIFNFFFNISSIPLVLIYYLFYKLYFLMN